jgi:hypothetical protein
VLATFPALEFEDRHRPSPATIFSSLDSFRERYQTPCAIVNCFSEPRARVPFHARPLPALVLAVERPPILNPLALRARPRPAHETGDELILLIYGSISIVPSKTIRASPSSETRFITPSSATNPTARVPPGTCTSTGESAPR